MNKLNISFLEEKYKIKFPETYVLFIKFFFVKEEFYRCQKVYLSDLNDYEVINYNHILNIKGDEFINIEFLDLEENLLEWDGGHYDETSYKEGFFPIALSDMGDRFCLGIKQLNFGKIYLDSNWPDRFLFVANNIFEFLSLIKIGEVESPPNNLNYSQLYKNWGEIFWRIRETKEENPMS